VTSPEKSRRVEIKHDDQTIAAAEVTASEHGDRPARASLHRATGHVPPGSRASLVDAVLNLPEVQASERLEATVPLGDGESLQRLRERTDETTTRPAGSTALVDANLPPDGEPDSGQQPARGGPPA
jgi:hypothetical protein